MTGGAAQVVVSDNEQVLRASSVRFGQYACLASLANIDEAVDAGVQLALAKKLAVPRKKVGTIFLFLFIFARNTWHDEDDHPQPQKHQKHPKHPKHQNPTTSKTLETQSPPLVQ